MDIDIKLLAKAANLSLARELEDFLDAKWFEKYMELHNRIELLKEKISSEEISKEIAELLHEFQDYRIKCDLLAYEAGVRMLMRQANHFHSALDGEDDK